MNDAAIVTARLEPAQQYFWQSVPLNNRTGSEVFSRLFSTQSESVSEAGIAVLLESPYPLPADSLPEAATKMARYSICAGAPRQSNGHAQIWIPERGKVLPFLSTLCKAAQPEMIVVAGELPEHLPFWGGWLGWLGYDLAWEIERLPWLKDDTLPFPVAFWYEPAQFAVLDHHLQHLWLATDTRSGLEQLLRQLVLHGESTPDATASECSLHSNHFSSIYIGQPENSSAVVSLKKHDCATTPARSSRLIGQLQTGQLQLETDKAAFEAAVRKAKAHIRAGDVFQVNHSLRFQAQTHLSSWSVYRTLQSINPSPFASYWRTPWGSVVSCSPERLVSLNQKQAESRPIAGTRPRGQTLSEDIANAQDLRRDTKEQAEHIMLVDLERNDLGRVCQWGSVQVEELMTIERYSHVMHLVSNVVGKLAADYSASDLVAALFPGGTITGCPKVRCMEIIEALEPVRRSLFYGSCGYLDRRGRLDLNILIRTLLMTRLPKETSSMSENDMGRSGLSENGIGENSGTATVWGQVGAGIVADSDPEREWFESLQKAQAQLLALGLR